MSDTNVIEPTEAAPAPQAVPEPLAEILAEEDSVLRAHKIRQANHFADLAPSLAKQERGDREREEELNEAARIQAEWEAKIAKEKAEQAEREKREGAAARIADLKAQIADHQRQIDEANAEVKRLNKLLKA